MLKAEVPSKGLLFGSFLYREDLFTDKFFTDFWQKMFGAGFSQRPLHNPLAHYYAKEMGEPLSRIFFLTSSLFAREYLLSTKLQAIEWERKWSVDNHRQVNVDIGFLSAENFLLATTKNYSHRVFLGQGIYADLTYMFHQGELQTLPWTYPDYIDEEKKNFFLWGRSWLLQQRSIDS